MVTSLANMIPGQSAHLIKLDVPVVDAQRGQGRRKLYQLYEHSLLRIEHYIIIDSLT